MEDKRTENMQDTSVTPVPAAVPSDVQVPADAVEPSGTDEMNGSGVPSDAAEPGGAEESAGSENREEVVESAGTGTPSGEEETVETTDLSDTEEPAETAKLSEEEGSFPDTGEDVPSGKEDAPPAGTAINASDSGEGDSPGETTAAVYDSGEEDPSGAEEDPPGSEPPRSNKKRIAFWIALLAVLAVAGGIYYAGCQFCSTHFMPGTQINGYDCSKMTVEEAEERFAQAAQEYVLNVRFRGGDTEILHAKDIGFAYRPDGSIDALLQGQDCMQWPKYLFSDSGYKIEVYGSVDEDKLRKALEDLPELQEENMETPKDAYLKFQDGNEQEDGRFVIIPDTEGSLIDIVQLAAGVSDAACRYEEFVDAEQIAGAYVEASTRADNARLVSRCKDLNDIVGASITYVLPDGKTMKLNADVMKDWLVRDEKGRLTKDEEVWNAKIMEFMQKVADNANTLGNSRRFKTTNRGTITISTGYYGYLMDQYAERDLLLEDLPACKKETRKPVYHLTPYKEAKENDEIGLTYIEADLTAQHVWCYVDGKLVMESDCVSGNMSDGHETPAGVFSIIFAQKNATLRGVMQKDGEYEYETKVKYWMPFYEDCGFHDAWWRPAFGGSIYKTDGSHGCINLPPEAAEQLFSYCEEKMPVVVYY